MARTADQIVTQQLGALHLQLVIAQARAEQAEDKVMELTAQLNALKNDGNKHEDVQDLPELSEVTPDEH